jgi:hypothetical protein
MNPGKIKFLNLCLVLTSLIGYLEWGKDNTAFLFQADAEVIAKLFSDPVAAVHPFTLIPLAGQILLLFTLVQQEPGRLLSYIGAGCISFLMLFIFVVGVMSANLKIVASTLPFLLTGVIAVRTLRNVRSQELKVESLS